MSKLAILQTNRMPLATLMGIVFVSAGDDEVVATMTVRPDLCTAGSIVHGGALMALADTVGAAATFINLPAGAKGTTTIESKTNFLASGPVGETLTATATPVHRGSRTQVWQTRITRADGRAVALVTQTQMVL
ncbi:PaaI family thioesterase [Phreatobacter sp.]|uniref:PaaI family thioesterase n=1 Tax=Phreatobacter sp. TaxID=1966341 RepID=UPI003F6EEF09